jgi:hypothetical protein
LDEVIAKQAQRAGRDVPERLKNAPELPLDLQFYFEAFCELNSCRQMGFAAGPIPITAIFAYSEHYGLSAIEEQDLIYYVQVLDRKFLDFAEKKNKQQNKSSKKPAKKGK